MSYLTSPRNFHTSHVPLRFTLSKMCQNMYTGPRNMYLKMNKSE